MKVSVVMSAFNCREYVSAAIESILSQDMKDIELIVVDDGSNDGTSEILSGFDNERVRVIYLPENTILGTGLNIAIASARGEYIAIMDADDVAFPERLSVQSRFLDVNTDVGIVGARGIRVAGSLDREIDRTEQPTDDAIIKARLLLMNGTSLLHPATMIRSEFIRNNNLWYLPRKMSADTAFWIKCVAKGVKFHGLEQPLIYKRRHDKNVSLFHKDTWEKEKFSLRVELLWMYFPELTGMEARCLALLMEQGRALQMNELFLAMVAANKTLRETRSFYGESKSHLHSIMKHYISRGMAFVSSRDINGIKSSVPR